MSKTHYIIPIFVPHEGCPYNCVFCNQNSITGQEQIINAEYVKNTINSYLATIKAHSTIEVSFFGGTFTAINEKKQIELLTVAREYKALGLIKYIRLSTRPDYIDDVILQRLKEYSVDIIELGVQSMDEEVLKRSGRGHNRQDTINASKLIKQYGFTLGHQIMIGLPGDNFQKDLNTVKEIIQLSPDLCRIYPALVLKDTPMEKMYKRGDYIPYTLEETIFIVKKIYIPLMYNNINIIRVGLQSTDNISVDGDIISGPYHEAFRELVEGQLITELIYDEINTLQGIVKININPKDISKLYAWKKKFFIDMKRQISSANIVVIQDDSLIRGEYAFEHGEKSWKMSIKGYLNKKAKEGNLYII